MNDINKKYLERMLEGVDANLTQIDGAFEQAEGHLSQMREQREEMVTARKDLRGLLGLPDEDESNLKLVNDETGNVDSNEKE